MRLELGVGDDRDCFLQHIVTKLVGDKSLHDLVHTELSAPGLVAELPNEDLVVPEVGTLEDLVNLVSSLTGLETLLDDVRGELELAEPHKVSCNKVEDLIVPHVVLQLEYVLNEVITIGVFNQVVDTTYDNVGQGQLLHLEALLEAALHHAAAVLVGADLVTVGHACPKDELCISCICLRSWAVGLLGLLRSFEGQKEGLYDMVAVGVG